MKKVKLRCNILDFPIRFIYLLYWKKRKEKMFLFLMTIKFNAFKFNLIEQHYVLHLKYYN